MNTKTIRYFAYGSNLLRVRLENRGVVLLDHGRPAQIANHRLVFNKKSTDGSSKANLMPAPGESTWGILFAVNPTSLVGLDAAEGAPGHYYQAQITVRTSDGEIKAMTYLAQPSKILKEADRPYDWYLALILAGAKACPMPADWIAHLRQVGQPKPYTKTPPDQTFVDAVAQLKAAGHDNWQDLLKSEIDPNPSVSSVVKNKL